MPVNALTSMTTPSGTVVNTSYYVSPFANASTRTVTIVYTCAANEVLTTNSFSVVYDVSGTTGTVSLDNFDSTTNTGGDGILTITRTVPVLLADTEATPTQSGAGAAVATLGAIPTTIALPRLGTSVNIPNTWNVDGKADPIGNPAWISLGGVGPSTQVLTPGSSFTIGATENNTGATRTTTIDIDCTNTRITPALSTITITVTQAA